MGEVVPARTSPTLHPTSPPTGHQLSSLALYELIYQPMLFSTALTSHDYNGYSVLLWAHREPMGQVTTSYIIVCANGIATKL